MSIFEPDDPAFLQNPYPVYQHLLAETPTFYHEDSQLWFFTRHHDVDAILRDRRFGRSILHLMSREELDIPPPNAAYEPFHKLGQHSMFDKEPPEHTRLRTLVHKAFTPRRIRDMQHSIEAIAQNLVDSMQQREQVDLLADYAAPLSVRVIAELLGIPEADQHRLRPWSNAIVKLYELDHTPAQADHAIQASQEFADYLKFLARKRREQPRDDLITALVMVEEAGDQLSEDEYVSTCVLLLNAGHEATVNVVGNGWLALFRHPQQLEKLRANPELVPTAIEEFMRYDSPLQMFRRWILEDMTYDGLPLKKGMQVGLIFGAANHDPAVFQQPASLDITRSPNPHISFGGGIHYCLGAPLARMELQVAYQTLLAHLPAMQLAADPTFNPAFVIHGLKELQVTL
ncbi:MAG: cytochrome P450 [Anaerolineaceae bacterium]|nr:cytochrome P450 [Anaerolineaceae bacterium]